MEFIQIAKLNKTFGIKGEYRAYCLSDFPSTRFKKGASFPICDAKGELIASFTLAKARLDLPFVILSFEEIHSLDEAEDYLGNFVCIEKSEATLPEDTYFIHDLIGCACFDENGQELGKVVDVFAYSQTKIIRVRKGEGKDIQIPFKKPFILAVDTQGKTIKVHLIEGMA